MFWSIISDYDLKTGLCELIDNALDIWLRGNIRRFPTIEVLLDADRQLKRPSVEKLKSRNKTQIDRMPWTLGLVEAMGAVELVTRLNLETKNRISLILLDSNFEIALTSS